MSMASSLGPFANVPLKGACGHFSMKKTAIDLFCGAGAVTWGLTRAGFRVTAALDLDETACATYRLNHPDVTLLHRDIRSISESDVRNACPDAPDLVAVCAPCQPFSSQNRHRRDTDRRADLILSSLPIIHQLLPTVVFLENVPGFENGDASRDFTNELERLGYVIGPLARVDAAIFGVAQRRRRVMLIAAYRRPSLLGKACQYSPRTRRTVADAIKGLPKPPVGADTNVRDPLHYSRRHHAITLERLRCIPKDGGSRSSLPQRLQLGCHKRVHANSFPDTYGRLSWDDVAPTLTTGCTDVTRGRYVHPEQDRAITLREAARIQSFPDSYEFAGNATQIAAQIGNSVPPMMIAEIGEAIASALEPCDRRGGVD